MQALVLLQMFDLIQVTDHPGLNVPHLSLFVQTNPAFCCPALITEAMTRRIRSLTGVPVVTVTYDGTSESKNEIILPYLQAVSAR